MTLGQNLATLRRESDMRQKELALRLKVSTGTISNYENDIHTPDPETLGKLAECFGVSVDYLLGRTRLRFDIRQLERKISQDYTVTDFINIMIGFDSNTVESLMEYALFLHARHSRQEQCRLEARED